MLAINWLAVLVAAVVAYLFGWAWHSPLLFMKPWMRMMKYNSMDDATVGAAVKPMQGMWLIALMTLIVSTVLAHLVVLVGITDWMGGIELSAGLWLGFAVPVMLNQVLWEKKSWQLFGFNAVYQLLSLCIMGVILSVWR
jgi:hypothetical protein